MNKTTHALVWVLAGLTLAALPAAASAAPATTRPAATRPAEQLIAEDAHLRPLLRIREAIASLNLTDEQKAKIEEIAAPYKAQLEAWREEHKDQIEKLRADAQTARQAKDRQKIQALAKEARELLQTLPKPQDTLAKIRDVLTPEQRQQLKAKLQDERKPATQPKPQKKVEKKEKKDAPVTEPAQ